MGSSPWNSPSRTLADAIHARVSSAALWLPRSVRASTISCWQRKFVREQVERSETACAPLPDPMACAARAAVSISRMEVEPVGAGGRPSRARTAFSASSLRPEARALRCAAQKATRRSALASSPPIFSLRWRASAICARAWSRLPSSKSISPRSAAAQAYPDSSPWPLAVFSSSSMARRARSPEPAASCVQAMVTSTIRCGRALQVEQRRLRLAVGLRLCSGQDLRDPVPGRGIGQLALQLAGVILVAFLLGVERLDLHPLQVGQLGGEVLRQLDEDEAVGSGKRAAQPGEGKRELRLRGNGLAERLRPARGVEIENRGASVLEKAGRFRGGGCDRGRRSEERRGGEE